MNKPERIAWLKTCTAKQRREYYAAIVKLGCAACNAPFTESGKNRTSLHHCQGHGFPAKRIFRPAIGLCWSSCHQIETGSLHGGKKSFEETFGTQEELLSKTEELLEDA